MSDKPKIGFAKMDKDKLRELSSKGGKSAHQRGSAHEWDSNEAKEAGRRGGLVSRGGRRQVLEEQEDE